MVVPTLHTNVIVYLNDSVKLQKNSKHWYIYIVNFNGDFNSHHISLILNINFSDFKL